MGRVGDEHWSRGWVLSIGPPRTAISLSNTIFVTATGGALSLVPQDVLVVLSKKIAKTQVLVRTEEHVRVDVQLDRVVLDPARQNFRTRTFFC